MGKCSVEADRESIKRACEPALSVQATNDDSDDSLTEIQPWSPGQIWRILLKIVSCLSQPGNMSVSKVATFLVNNTHSRV